MIPAGVFNQGGKPPIIYINFNGSYVEDNFPSSPTWPAGYVEYEYRFTTTSATLGLISTGPNLSIPEIGAVLAFISNNAGSNSRLANVPSNSTERIDRHISYLSDISMSLTLPAEYNVLKVHCIGIGGSANDSYKVDLFDDESPLNMPVSDLTAGNTFTLSPYDEGSFWKSSNEIILGTSVLTLRITPLDEFSYTRLNAMAIEIL